MSSVPFGETIPTRFRTTRRGKAPTCRGGEVGAFGAPVWWSTVVKWSVAPRPVPGRGRRSPVRSRRPYLHPSLRRVGPPIWGAGAPNMGRDLRCGQEVIARRWVGCVHMNTRRIRMSYMQESIINSIHQERHREANIERLSGQSRLPKRLRRHALLLPMLTSRSVRSPAASIPRPAA